MFITTTDGLLLYLCYLLKIIVKLFIDSKLISTHEQFYQVRIILIYTLIIAMFVFLPYFLETQRKEVGYKLWNWGKLKSEENYYLAFNKI